MNKDPIKCNWCGKFISYADLDKGVANSHFQVKWDWQAENTYEEEYFECKKCIEN